MPNRTNYHCKLFLLLLGLSLSLIFAACGGNKRTETDTELIIGTRADEYVIEPLKSRLGMYPLNTQICESLREQKKNGSSALLVQLFQ